MPPLAAKSPALGIVGCVGVIVTSIIFSIAFHQFAVVSYEIGMLDPQGPDEIPYLPDLSVELQNTLTGALAMILISGFLILGFWIVSIVATAANRGRPWGIVGIVLAFVVPFFGMVVSAGTLY